MQLCHRECFESERSWSRRNEASWRSECDRFASSDDAPPRYLRGPDESELNRLTLEEETRRYARDERWRMMEDEPSTRLMVQHRRMPRRHLFDDVQLADAAGSSRSGGGVWNGPLGPPRRGTRLPSPPRYERRIHDAAYHERRDLLLRRTTFSGEADMGDERWGRIQVEGIPWESERRRDEQWSDPVDWHAEEFDFSACDRHWL